MKRFRAVFFNLFYLIWGNIYKIIQTVTKNKDEFNVSSINECRKRQWISVRIKQSAFCTKKKYLKIMGCLEKAEIFPFTYDSPQQSIACHPDLSDCSFNRQYLQVHTYHMPSLYFSSSSSSSIQVRTKGTWVFLKVLDAFQAVFGKC